MEAKPLLGGHARIGSWMAVSVRLKNDGPPIAGELRLAGGSQGKSRFGIAVDLPTQSDKTYVLYAQPPAFGRELDVSPGGRDPTLASTKVRLHDPRRQPAGRRGHRRATQDIVSSIDLLPEPEPGRPGRPRRSTDPAPGARRGLAGVRSARLAGRGLELTQHRAARALRGWIAGGGRLVIVGGTTGPGALGAFPDDLLPFRPAATMDVPAASLTAFLGSAPVGRSGPAGAERRAHRRSVAGHRRRPGRRRRADATAAAR